MFGRWLAFRCVWLTTQLCLNGQTNFADYQQVCHLSLRTYRRDLSLLKSFGIITRTEHDHAQGKVLFVEVRFA